VRVASEAVEVVGGEPTVGQGLPHVSRGDGGMDKSFGPAAPFQVDTFSQEQVQKVDILWVIDDGAGMKAKQDRVKQNFVSFMQFLTQQQIDFHLGVVSTDVYDPQQSGRLINYAGLPQPWIEASDANAQADFVKNASLGGTGSGDEKGLLGGMLALTPPLSPSTPALGGNNCATESGGGVGCFLRPEAALYTIVVSDSNDNSCSPVLPIDGCDEGQIQLGGYGSTDYWSRFYKGVKGPGGASKLAAITGTSSDLHDCSHDFAGFCDAFINAGGFNACAGTHPFCTGGPSSDGCCQALRSCYASFTDKSAETLCHFAAVSDGNVPPHAAAPYYQITGSWNGCASFDPADGGIQFTATYGSRYVATAQATGGMASSICDQDYTPALAQLGLQASGLRSDFPLSRAPISTSISVLVAPPGSSTPAQVLPGPGTWSYLRCSGSTPTNVVRFTDAARPRPGAQISISYDVNVRGAGTCP
jgi:hypothetical protein